MQLSQKRTDVRRPTPRDIGRAIDLFLPDDASAAALEAVGEAVQMAELLERQVERAAAEEAVLHERDAETTSKRGSPPGSLPTTRAGRKRASLTKLTRDAGMSVGARMGCQLPREASGRTAPSETAVQVVGAILRHWYAAAVEYQRVADRDAIGAHLQESALGSANLPGVPTAAVRVLYWRAMAAALGRACASEAGPGIDLVRASAVGEIDAETRRLAALGGSAAAEADARLATLDRMVLAAATGRWEGDLPARAAGVSDTEWARLADVADHFLASELTDDDDESLASAWRAPWPVDSAAARAKSGPTGGAGWPMLERATATFLLEGLVRATALENVAFD